MEEDRPSLFACNLPGASEIREQIADLILGHRIKQALGHAGKSRSLKRLNPILRDGDPPLLGIFNGDRLAASLNDVTRQQKIVRGLQLEICVFLANPGVRVDDRRQKEIKVVALVTGQVGTDRLAL